MYCGAAEMPWPTALVPQMKENLFGTESLWMLSIMIIILSYSPIQNGSKQAPPLPTATVKFSFYMNASVIKI